jgi:hypothetical protein
MFFSEFFLKKQPLSHSQTLLNLLLVFSIWLPLLSNVHINHQSNKILYLNFDVKKTKNWS